MHAHLQQWRRSFVPRGTLEGTRANFASCAASERQKEGNSQLSRDQAVRQESANKSVDCIAEVPGDLFLPLQEEQGVFLADHDP
jgi:hypothetical protein